MSFESRFERRESWHVADRRRLFVPESGGKVRERALACRLEVAPWGVEQLLRGRAEGSLGLLDRKGVGQIGWERAIKVPVCKTGYLVVNSVVHR